MKIKNVVIINIFLFIFFLFAFSNLKAQIVFGTVVDTNDNPINFVNVLILDLNDSTLIVGNNFKDGNFYFENINRESFLVKFTQLGYTTLIKKVDAAGQKSVNMGVIVLSQNPILLEEVSIIGNIPIIEIKNGNISLNVNSTILKNEESLKAVIRNAPGIIENNNGKLEVLGKGEPLIYINGRKIMTDKQLEVISPKDVRTIEILNNPGSQYEASTHTVINITTDKKNLVFGGRFHNTLEYTQFFNNKTMLILNRNGKRNSQYFAYSYEIGKTKNEENSENFIFHLQEDYVNNFNSISYNKSSGHTAYYAFDQSIGKKNNVGFQWMANFNNSDITSDMISRNLISQNSYYTVNKIFQANNLISNNFNMNYSLIPDTINNFTILMDYALYNKDNNMLNNQTLNEKEDSYNSINKTEYNIFSSQLDYGHKIYKYKINLNAGIKFSSVTNDNNNSFKSNTDTSLVTIDQFSFKTILEEKNGAAYINLSKSYKKTVFNFGIRAEINQWNLFIDDIQKASSEDLYLFPSVSVNFPVFTKHNLSLNYSKNINRVGYQAMSQEYTYINPYLYRQGNPYLKPAISNNFSINYSSFNMLFLSIDYTSIENFSTLGFYNQDSIIVAKFMNFNKQTLTGRLNFAVQNNKISSNIGISVIKNFFEYNYLGNIVKPKGIGYVLSTNNIINLTKTIELYFAAQYYDYGEEDFYHYFSEYYFDFGLRKYFLDKKLRLAIYTTLKSPSKYMVNFEYININHEYIKNPFMVYCTVMYSLNYKNWNKNYSSNDQEKSRL